MCRAEQNGGVYFFNLDWAARLGGGGGHLWLAETFHFVF